MADPARSSDPRSPDPSRSSPPPRACLGATFFSRGSAASGKSPTCAGISRRLGEDTSLEAASLPPEVAPDGDFSFCCVGLASYRQGQPEKAGATPGVSGGAPSTSEAVLPQCMGVQIIRAQAPLPPVTPTTPAAAAARSEDARPGAAPRAPARVGAPPPPSARPTPPPLPALGDVVAAVPDLAAKMGRSAKKVADKMASNAAIVGVAARRAAEDMVGGFLPGGGERGRGK